MAQIYMQGLEFKVSHELPRDYSVKGILVGLYDDGVCRRCDALTNYDAVFQPTRRKFAREADLTNLPI